MWGLDCSHLSFLNALFSYKNEHEVTFIPCSSYVPCACKAVISFLKKTASLSLPFMSDSTCTRWEPQVWTLNMAAPPSFRTVIGSSAGFSLPVCFFFFSFVGFLVFFFFFLRKLDLTLDSNVNPLMNLHP